MQTIEHEATHSLSNGLTSVVASGQNTDITQQPKPNSGLMDQITKLIDINITPEKMDQVERLFKLHQQLMEREAEQAFNDAVAKAQADIQPVVANRTNTHTESHFADLAAIHAIAKPIWTKHGLSVITYAKASTMAGCINITGELRHTGGHKIQFSHDWPLDTAGAKGVANKTDIQGTGSAITYARRYTECMLFDISISKDNDGNPSGKAKKQQELSSDALDHLAALDEASSPEHLKQLFQNAYDSLEGDGFGRNQLIKRRDAIKRDKGWK